MKTKAIKNSQSINENLLIFLIWLPFLYLIVVRLNELMVWRKFFRRFWREALVDQKPTKSVKNRRNFTHTNIETIETHNLHIYSHIQNYVNCKNLLKKRFSKGIFNNLKVLSRALWLKIPKKNLKKSIFIIWIKVFLIFSFFLQYFTNFLKYYSSLNFISLFISVFY